MGAKSGITLKFLQWFIRGIQFCCCALVLAIFSYFLATMHNHDIDIPSDVRAVEGISGVGVLYTIGGLLLLCCLAGIPFLSFIAIVLDVAFAAAFIYVAVVNRGGASSCNDYVDTPFGRGQGTNKPNGSDGFTNLPSFRQACQMQSACLAVSIVVIFFFIFSIFVEVSLVRHHRKESRFGPSPANNYTSGYGRKGFFSRFRRQNTIKSEDPNVLPEHTTPDQIRQSYNTEATAIGRDSTNYHKHGDADYHHGTSNPYDGQTAWPERGVNDEYRTPQTANQRYGDGTYNV